jgi:hypothetical protein
VISQSKLITVQKKVKIFQLTIWNILASKGGSSMEVLQQQRTIMGGVSGFPTFYNRTK